MTLPDFIEFEPFNRLRRLMNALLPDEFTAGYTINRLTQDDLDRALEGVEGITVDDISNVQRLSDGTLAYKDRRVLLYIRDRRASREYDPLHYLPKFHIANCKTLREMREHGQFEKYVISRRTDGKFKMNFIYEFGKTDSAIHGLRVCRNCLIRLSYKRYRQMDNKTREEIYENFLVNEYFAAYPNNQITTLPLHADDTAPLNDYNGGFRETSTRYRAEHGWACENEECRVDLSNPSHHKYLHTHHVNAQKHDDRMGNHKALCIRCHAEEPMHAHLKNSPDYKEFIIIYPRLLYLTRRA
jgi:hypothetical protein